ncbi:MAG: copper chaperone PCu(A)C [Shewanella sp.]
MTLRTKIKQLFTAFGISVVSLGSYAEVTFDQGHVRAMPPSAPNTAAYLSLSNKGDKNVKLVGVRTDIARESQLHTIIEQDGVVKMRQIHELTIAPQHSLTLSAGGDHIMLLGLKTQLTLGQSVGLQLQFDDGQTLDVSLPVMAIGAEETHHQHH